MSDELIDQGLELMVLGMGTVFVFLTLLVVATSAMSRLIGSFGSTEPAALRTSTPNDAQLRRVIAEAVRQHRKARR